MTEAERTYIREYQRGWRARNRDRNREIGRAWAKRNPELVKEKNRLQRQKREMSGKTKEYFSRPEVKAKHAEAMRLWRATPEGALIHNARTRIRRALRGISKAGRTISLLGCTPEELKSWLEGWFEPGMSWDNYGEWHVDHNRPCESFDLSDPEQQKRCFNFLNLRPLWAEENIRKGALYGV